MRRRELLSGFSAAAATWPLGVRAQQTVRIPRIGLLFVNNADQERAIFGDDPFGFRDLGYFEGKTIAFERRYANGNLDRLAVQAQELVNLRVDAIVTGGPGIRAARRATTTIPIVVATAGDLVADGFVATLAHPGGNLTGSAGFAPQVSAKRLELLKDIAPSIKRVGVLVAQGLPSNEVVLRIMASKARGLNLELMQIEVSGSGDYEGGFLTRSIDGMVITDPAQFLGNAALIASLTIKGGLPTVAPPALARAGALLGYGASIVVLFHHAATFVDKILRCARPGDIPIEQATKFETIVNLKTAAALAVEIPPTLLAAADEVIE